MPVHISDVSTPEERAEWGRRSAAATAARKIEVNTDAVTFGVEIECFLPYRTLPMGGYHNPTQLPSPFPYGWKASSDGSLRASPEWSSDYTGIEIISPVLSGTTGLNQVITVLAQLRALRAKVNLTSGLHVHIGMPSLIGDRANDFELVASWVARLVALVSRYEPVLLALGGTKTRFGNRYCESIKDKWVHFRLRKPVLHRLADYSRAAGRYRTLNVENLFTTKRTVEFRAFAGTLNDAKVIGYIITAMALCHKAASNPRAVKFDANAELTIEDLPGKLTAMIKELKAFGWPTGAKAQWEQAIRKNQRWNVNKALDELRAHMGL